MSTLVVTPSFSLNWSLQDPQVHSTIVDGAALKYARQLLSGTGLDENDRLWHDRRTLAGSANDDLDITGLEATYFGFSVTISLARLRGIFLINTSVESGDMLVLDSSVADAYTGPFHGSATAQLEIGADSPLILMNKKDGYGLSSLTNKMLRVANPGANPITYEIVLFGNSA